MLGEKRYKVDGVAQSNRQKDAFRLTFGELISEMWKRRIIRSGVESTDRLRLQKAFDEDYRMVERKKMCETHRSEKAESSPVDRLPATARAKVGKLSFASSSRPTIVRNQRPSTAHGIPARPTTARISIRDYSRTLDVSTLSEAEVIAQLLQRAVSTTGRADRDRELLQCLFDEESERRASIRISSSGTKSLGSLAAPTSGHLSTSKSWASGSIQSDSVLDELAPDRQLLLMSNEEVFHGLQVRRLNSDGDAAERRQELRRALEKEYACVMDGWMDVRLLTTSSLHSEMNRRGLLITGNRSLDILNLQGTLSMELCERFYRYKAIIENYLLPLDVYDQPKEMIFMELSKRGLASADNWDQDAKLLQRVLDDEYLTFLKLRMKHGLPVSVKLVKPHHRLSAAGSLPKPSEGTASTRSFRRPSGKRTSMAVVDVTTQAKKALASVAEEPEDYAPLAITSKKIS